MCCRTTLVTGSDGAADYQAGTVNLITGGESRKGPPHGSATASRYPNRLCPSGERTDLFLGGMRDGKQL